MIKCERPGMIAIEGDDTEVLADFGFIANCLNKFNGFSRADIACAFIVGLYREEIEASDKSREECWDMISEFVGKTFRKEVDDAHR